MHFYCNEDSTTKQIKERCVIRISNTDDKGSFSSRKSHKMEDLLHIKFIL